jgi:hypothetical protein
MRADRRSGPRGQHFLDLRRSTAPASDGSPVNHFKSASRKQRAEHPRPGHAVEAGLATITRIFFRHTLYDRREPTCDLACPLGHRASVAAAVSSQLNNPGSYPRKRPDTRRRSHAR